MFLLSTDTFAVEAYQVIHRFQSRSARQPNAALVADKIGNLYGTAYLSGPDTCGSQGCGVVFKLTNQPDGKWKYSVIHHFNGVDGEGPVGGLIFDSLGNLYGTTWRGGQGFGTVFRLSSTSQGWKETVLYSFGPAPGDVINPITALMLDKNGALYGTAAGGTYEYGGVFRLERKSDGWKETVIYNFTGGLDGRSPNGHLVSDSRGNLYGSTDYGGEHHAGVIFKLTPSAVGNWRETVLHSFKTAPEGGAPGELIFDRAGNLYGTTQLGGKPTCNVAGPDCGVVFQLKRSAGLWTLNVLHRFNGADGSTPYAGLVFDSDGNLYGTTPFGGDNNYGVVFKLSKSVSTWSETVLHSFNLRDGAYPWGGVILSTTGVLYGAAFQGGIDRNSESGVVYSIAPSGNTTQTPENPSP